MKVRKKPPIQGVNGPNTPSQMKELHPVKWTKLASVTTLQSFVIVHYQITKTNQHFFPVRLVIEWWNYFIRCKAYDILKNVTVCSLVHFS